MYHIPCLLLSCICICSSIYPIGEKKDSAQSKQEITYPVTGTLYPIQVTKISSQVSGRVSAVICDVGDKVEKDQVLLKLDPVFFDLEYQKAQNAFQLAQISFEDASREFQRMKSLWEKTGEDKPSISKKQYEDATTQFRQKEILLGQARLDLEYLKKELEETSIKAPYSGVLTKRFVDVGESIATVPPVHIVEIMDISKIIFEFSLPQDISSEVRQGMLVSIQVEGQKQKFTGKIDTIFPNIDMANRCFKCRVIFDNEKELLKPGSFVRGKIQLQ